MALPYDVREVVTEFMNRRTSEVFELQAKMADELNTQPVVKRLLAEVAQEALNKGASPVMVTFTGLWYGVVLGILLERDRIEKEKK